MTISRHRFVKSFIFILRFKNKNPRQKKLSRTKAIPRYHLDSRHSLASASLGYEKYPLLLTQAHSSQNTPRLVCPVCSAPSAVHLTICFRPDSQRLGLSVRSFTAFISASTVYSIEKVYHRHRILSSDLINF